MEATSGLNMTVVGITTVFLALTILVAVVSALARVLTTPSPPAATVSDAAAPAAPPAPDERLRRVALAAFAYHQSRRSTARPSLEPSPWLRAARAEQITAIRARG